MIVKRHLQVQPDFPFRSNVVLPKAVEQPAPRSDSPGIVSEQAITGTPLTPIVRGIYPAFVKEAGVNTPTSAQQGLLLQHDDLNNKINLLISQQPTYEAFVQKYQPYVASTPGAVDNIGALFANAVTRFWTAPRPGEKPSSPPQDQLINLHRQMLSTQAALRAADGTLSSAGKALIDKAFEYPTQADREKAFPHGSRLGVYPLTVDDNTPTGARLAGAFMLTATDGSSATTPHWPNGDKSLLASEDNGPVVLYTPGEGFEEFANPAQLQAVLMQRIDNGGVPATLLSESLPLPAERLRKPLRGQDLTLGFSPIPEDVTAAAIPQLLERQADELNALTHSDTSDMDGEHIAAAMNNAANWTSQFDGSNAMLARAEKLEDKQQPQWLKNLLPVNAGHYQFLDTCEQKTAQALAPLLEAIPSLQHFANQQINAALKQKYPTANFDADKIVVHTYGEFVFSRKNGEVVKNVTNSFSSLTDVALKNATLSIPAENYQNRSLTMTASLTDTGGKPVLGADGKPIVLEGSEIAALVSKLEVGSNYIKLLKKRMAPEAVTGDAGKVRTAWKANLSDVMRKQAFLAELNPLAYPPGSPGPEWVQTVLDFPDPAKRPQVEGRTIVANTVSHYGKALQGVIAIDSGKGGPLILYSPDAPDGMSFRQVADRVALETLFEQPQWKTYAESKVSPLNPGGPDAAIQDRLNESVFSALDREDRGDRPNGPGYLSPIQDDFQDALYKQLAGLLIDEADAGSVSSAELAAETNYNKIMFGIEIATQLLGCLPAAGRFVSTALRLTRAGLRVLKAPGNAIVNVLNRPDRLAMLYSRVGGSGGATAGSRARPLLRPVLSAPALSRAVQPLAPGTPGVGSVPDISGHSVPDSLLSGRTLRGDGTYQVGDQFYVRYTDGTGVSKPYEISPIYKIEGGPVRVINPHTRKTVAFLQPAGAGEWRQNRMLGGAKGGVVQGVKRPNTEPVQPGPSSAAKQPKSLEAFPGEKALLEPPVKGVNRFYHYTGKDPHARIMASNVLEPSRFNLKGEALPKGQRRHYFTDLAPEDMPTEKISEAIFGKRKHGNALDKMTYYYEVNTSGLNVVKSTENAHIFYVETPFDIPLSYRSSPRAELTRRVIYHGETPYTPAPPS